MGKRIATSLTECAILLSVVLTLMHVTVPVRAQPMLASGWMTQPVTPDGRITTLGEWSDAIPVDLTLSNQLKQLISVRTWIKNDAKWIFVLATVKWPANDIDRYDRFRIFVYSGPLKPGTIADESGVYFDGSPTDRYRVVKDGTEETYDDTAMSPPGKNNVSGGASYNGTHYWFEFGKPLNTGDQYDLVLVPGQTYTNVKLLMRDASNLRDEENLYQVTSILMLAPVLPSVGLIEPEHGAISGVSRVDFKAYVLGHLSKVTLIVEGKDHDMKFNQETGLYEASLTLADGVFKWRVNALGVLGNVTSIPERSLTVDATKPAVTIRSPTSGEVINTNEVLVSWEALDATSGIAKVEVKIDASNWIDVTGKTSHTATWVVEGNHEVRVRAADRAGNVAEKVVTFTFLPYYRTLLTYWYAPVILVAVIVVIAAGTISRRGPPRSPVRPPEVKPFKIQRPPKPPTREELLKELEELYRSGRITETAYRRLKKKYETERN